jgi:hypothetical protein
MAEILVPDRRASMRRVKGIGDCSEAMPGADRRAARKGISANVPVGGGSPSGREAIPAE